jgi:hypothetical protein
VLAATVIFEERGIWQLEPGRSRRSFQFGIPFAVARQGIHFDRR